ncbi:PD-(D/E)XK nuclease family protein [Chryseobacterium vrystaatense]|uniref:PD-(D/E)XK nuclease superfamily protein n=1 Tax=Chryseobacterium vrystaatense TaxID=307480 RepID=A0A1M4ZFN1_9FLAO|nr:PD-(D/E)XK nuclease family protein [Chryseobacterium vrystaatense]SHF16821.1 PD-(D/E)XK nuclease superfamily protein [Chryseobacterium vrystaatense]
MSKYYLYTAEELEEHNSNYIIRSWSFSKVGQFCRNEKAFEMIYIYGYQSTSSASGVSGNAYHEALSSYFKSKQNGIELTLPEVEMIAFQYIDEVPANKWKLQITTPTIAESKIKAIKSTTALLTNFFHEKYKYEDHIAKILDVEISWTGYLTINGVDIPLPCNAVIDLVIETHDGRIIIIDHKSTNAFSSEAELSLAIGKQAMTYVKTYEAHSGLVVDEVWFCQNKYSKNQKGGDQLNMFPVVLSYDTRVLYEDLLYENIKRLIEAVSNPDYVYLINDFDNLVNREELYEFWSKTRLNEIDVFDIDESEVNKEMVAKRHRKIRDSSVNTVSPKIIKHFHNKAASFIKYDLNTTDMTQSQKIEHKLKVTCSADARVAHMFSGFSSDTYLLEVGAGTKISSIRGYNLEIASALNVANVRISKDLKVFEGKSYLQVETGKKKDKFLPWDSTELIGQKVPLGKDNFGETIYWDLENESTPFMLICGAAGSGKSASIISSTEYIKRMEGIDQIIILDPKYEFTSYDSDPKIQVYNDILDIERKVEDLVLEMNNLIKYGEKKKIVIIFDEFADAVANSRKGKDLEIWEDVEIGYYKQSALEILQETAPRVKTKYQKTGTLRSLEENMRIIKQKGRSVGIRGIDATQRASSKVITGDAKVNYSLMICFRVPKAIDSTVVLDDSGAEVLTGMGDGLLKSPEFPDLVRFQSFFYQESAQ